jgi:hypothetical protein
MEANMLEKVKEYFEFFLLFFLTAVLVFLFLLLIPIFKDPHGFLVVNQLSDFSNNSPTLWSLFGSAAVCAVLGALLMSWTSVLTVGSISSLFSMTYFLLWVDSVFSLSVQFQTFDFLKSFGMGLLFIYLFFFTIGYVDLRNEKILIKSRWKGELISNWLIGWICFYFLISIILVFKSFKYFEPQVSLAIGFFGICFLNYLLFLLLKKKSGNENPIFSKMGRIFFSCWLLIIVLMEIGTAWFR